MQDKVLLCDEHDQLRRHYDMPLRMAGFLPLQAHSLDEAHTLVERHHVHLAVCSAHDGHRSSWKDLTKSHSKLEIITLKLFNEHPLPFQVLSNSLQKACQRLSEPDHACPPKSLSAVEKLPQQDASADPTHPQQKTKIPKTNFDFWPCQKMEKVTQPVIQLWDLLRNQLMGDLEILQQHLNHLNRFSSPIFEESVRLARESSDQLGHTLHNAFALQDLLDIDAQQSFGSCCVHDVLAEAYQRVQMRSKSKQMAAIGCDLNQLEKVQLQLPAAELGTFLELTLEIFQQQSWEVDRLPASIVCRSLQQEDVVRLTLACQPSGIPLQHRKLNLETSDQAWLSQQLQPQASLRSEPLWFTLDAARNIQWPYLRSQCVLQSLGVQIQFDSDDNGDLQGCTLDLPLFLGITV